MHSRLYHQHPAHHFDLRSSRIAIVDVLVGRVASVFNPLSLLSLPAPIGVRMCDQNNPILSGAGDVKELLEVTLALLVDSTGHVEVKELPENRIGAFEGISRNSRRTLSSSSLQEDV